MIRRHHAPEPALPAEGRRHWRRRSLALGVMVILLLGLGGGAAYGYFSSTGSGAGSAGVATMTTVAVVATAGTPGSPLLPGGSGDIVFSVTNPNSFAVSLVGVQLEGGGSITADAGHAACTTGVVTLNVPAADLPVSITANATVPVDLAGAVTMAASAPDQCQGATFTVPITITVHSS